MLAPESPAGSSGAGAAARAHWDVLAAVGILVGVLLVIDGASIGEPMLLLSFGPLAFLTFAAVFPLTVEAVAAWISGFVGFALTARDARYAGLAYPAIALAIPLLVHRLLRRRGAKR